MMKLGYDELEYRFNEAADRVDTLERDCRAWAKNYDELKADYRKLLYENTDLKAQIAAHQKYEIANNICAAELESVKASRDHFQYLWELRGKALKRPCIACGYEPKEITLAVGSCRKE